MPVQVAGYGSAFFTQVARDFAAQRPGVQVRLYGDARISDQVRVRVLAGDYPDATDAVLPYPALIRAGRVVDLTPYLDGPNWDGTGRWRDDFRPGVLARWESEGRVYGLPFAHAVWTFFYDQRRFRAQGWKEPQTWDEFFVLCEKMESAGLAPVSLPGVFMRYGDAVLRSAHYNLVGPDGWQEFHALVPGTRTDARFVRAATVLQTLSTRHLLKGWEGMTHTAAQLAFIEGRAAMTLSASWFVNEMRGKLPPDFELGAMNLPVFDDGVTPPGTLQAQSGYYFIFNSGDERRVRAAVDFFRFLTASAQARRFARTVDSPVAVQTVDAEDYSPLMAATARLLAVSPGSFDASPPAVAGSTPLLNQALIDARYRLMTGRVTPEEFGRLLENAAATERARRAEPLRVEPKHDNAAGWLLALLAAALGWLAVRWARLVRVRWRRAGVGRRPAGDANEAGGAGGAQGETTPVLPVQAPEHLGPLPRGLALGFVGPALAVYAAFVLVPAGMALLWAWSSADGLGGGAWVGWFNFAWLLRESDVFWQALRNNLFLMVVPTVVVVPVALALAVLLQRGGRWAGGFRAVVLFPNLLGGIAAALLWCSAYEPASGLVNAALVGLGQGLGALSAPALVTDWLQGFAGFAWLAQANLYWALVPIYLWLAGGFNLVLYLAAMQSVPEELYEAARLEGASTTQQFFRITLPLIREVVVISMVFQIIAGLNAFELIWLLTAQEPASGLHTLSTFMVTTLFQDFAVGRATAIAVVLFILVATGSALVLGGLRREVVER